MHQWPLRRTALQHAEVLVKDSNGPITTCALMLPLRSLQRPLVAGIYVEGMGGPFAEEELLGIPFGIPGK